MNIFRVFSQHIQNHAQGHLGDFRTIEAARAYVGERVGHTLLWKRRSITGTVSCSEAYSSPSRTRYFIYDEAVTGEGGDVVELGFLDLEDGSGGPLRRFGNREAAKAHAQDLIRTKHGSEYAASLGEWEPRTDFSMRGEQSELLNLPGKKERYTITPLRYLD